MPAQARGRAPIRAARVSKRSWPSSATQQHFGVLGEFLQFQPFGRDYLPNWWHLPTDVPNVVIARQIALCGFPLPARP